MYVQTNFLGEIMTLRSWEGVHLSVQKSVWRCPLNETEDEKDIIHTINRDAFLYNIFGDTLRSEQAKIAQASAITSHASCNYPQIALESMPFPIQI